MTIGKYIGNVTHYNNRIGATALDLEDGLNMVDTEHIRGFTTDFSQQVGSMVVEHCTL